ncbi:isochorismate synthase [Brevibacterium album]|uniref:isochorismate synthase n=1 Tax=Brevibacterium album TaxID=417948 RepID=UPI00041E6D51|nr:isochorismate synthase [Brevibacterium album]
MTDPASESADSGPASLGTTAPADAPAPAVSAAPSGSLPHQDEAACLPRLTVRSWFVDGVTPSAPAPFAASIPSRSLDFLEQLPEDRFSCWVRGRSGIVGFGRRLRLSAQGPRRFRELEQKWTALADGAEVDDRVELLGSGLVGFSAVAFADSSAVSSIIDVPEFVLGRRDGRVWLTHIAEVPGTGAGAASETGAASGSDSVPGAAGDAHASGGAGTAPGLDFRLTPRPLREPPVLSSEPGDVSPERYEEMVARASARLRSPRAGERKVVLARDEVITTDGDIDVRAVVGRLNQAFPNTWTFNVGGLVGATPELLIGVENGTVHSRVLAGTYRVERDPAEELAAARAQLSGHKDSIEHSYAIDSLAATLGSVTDELHVDREPHLLQLANVIHLASDAHGTLRAGTDGRPISPFRVAEAVHPTAAVGGTPRERAFELIAELEGMDRGRYAGPVGWVDGYGNGQFGIALRCGQLEERDRIRIFAGAGIMPDSDPVSERRETDAKLSPMRAALGVERSPR